MKYEWLKLLRDWTFWVLLFLSVVMVIGYSAIYLQNTDNITTTWYYSVSKYQNDADIAEQIEMTRSRIAEVKELLQSGDSRNGEALREQLRMLQSSEKILQFLHGKAEEYPYKQLCDGSIIDAYARNPRSYGRQSLESVFFFQIVALIFIIGQIVNQGKTSGTFVISMMMRRRKKMFFRQAGLSLAVFTVSYLVQIGMIATVRGLLSGDVQKVLMFNGENVIVLGENTEFWLLCISIYLVLLVFWSIAFFLSQTVDNLPAFSVASLLVCALLMIWVMFSNNPLISKFFMTITDAMIEDMSAVKTAAVFLLRALFIGGCLFGAYLVSQKKNYRIRYE